MNNYIIDYGYNNTDKVQADSLDHEKEIAADNCSFEQDAITIFDADGNKLAWSKWYSVLLDDEDKETAVAYWEYRGFYGPWWDL